MFHQKNSISADEYNILQKYININRPKFLFKHYSWSMRNVGYYWELYYLQPRLDWLDDQIKLVDKQ